MCLNSQLHSNFLKAKARGLSIPPIMDSDQRSVSSIEASDGSSIHSRPRSPSDNFNVYNSRRRSRHRRASCSFRSSDDDDDEEKALEQEDRISNLPNSLILHILSFLKTKHATRTTILSKRWHHLWTFVPVLNFSPNYLDTASLNRFVINIHHTLILHQSPKIDKFLLQLDCRKAFASDVDVWLRFAARKNVEELDLDFRSFAVDDFDEFLTDEDVFGDGFGPYVYVLPLTVFTISSLVTLKLFKCGMGHHRHGDISWKSLRVLSLSEISLCNDLVRDVLYGSPSLEVMEFHDCWGFDFIDIKSDSLRKVVINKFGRYLDLETVGTLRLTAPNVLSMDITGVLETHKICLTNSPSLVDAKLDFRLPGDRPGFYCIQEEYPKILKELFQNIWHVKDLTVGSRFLKILSVLEEKTMPYRLSNLVCLRIETQLSKWELPGIARLLELTPLLKTLVIKMTSGIYQIACGSEFLESYLSSQMSFFMLTLLNITSVKIVDFVATEREIELILFLLRNARLLEKMIICTRKPDPHRYVSVKRSLKVTQRLLSSPRCSLNAVVLFS